MAPQTHYRAVVHLQSEVRSARQAFGEILDADGYVSVPKFATQWIRDEYFIGNLQRCVSFHIACGFVMKSADYLPVLSKWGTRRKKTTGVRGTRYDSFEVFKAALVVQRKRAVFAARCLPGRAARCQEGCGVLPARIGRDACHEICFGLQALDLPAFVNTANCRPLLELDCQSWCQCT